MISVNVFARECALNRTARVFHACLAAKEGRSVRYGIRALTSHILSENEILHPGEYEWVLSGTTRRLENLLKENGVGTKFDYVSVDLEGHEEEVLGSLSWDRWSIQALTVERPSENLVKLLRRQGFRPVHFIPNLDVFFLHESNPF